MRELIFPPSSDLPGYSVASKTAETDISVLEGGDWVTVTRGVNPGVYPSWFAVGRVCVLEAHNLFLGS